ncbi:MAG: type IV pili methyl-accepting chemotaxis transducer N-terminal domain-containing protein [Gammaproteobacteria bacterium]|nr:type IV pili methyl-accepting chemotaxis transducer N-terminal domain-containing protein [Gammaproteobacteria bacterium]
MKNKLRQYVERSLLLEIGLLMSVVVLLAVVSMVSSAFIAQTSQGLAAAINQSGSLRMQSYRIGVALADESVSAPQRAVRADALAREFEARLTSPRLVDAVPRRASPDAARAYDRVRDLWAGRMKGPLTEEIRLLAADAARPQQTAPRREYVAGVDAFVAEIDYLVLLLEDYAERRIDLLRTIQGVSLLVTIGIVVFTMALVLRRVVRPLGELLASADRARRGDFSARVGATGPDELGRVGSAMNLMAESLSALYDALEQRVAEKTQDLARSNHALELLYRTSKALNEAPVSEPLLRDVLRQVAGDLGTGPVTLCLRDEDAPGRGTVLVTTRPAGEAGCLCWGGGCRACEDLSRPGAFDVAQPEGGAATVLSFPVTVQDRRFGVLLVDLPAGAAPDPDQRRLLGTLAGHIGTALDLQRRLRESRRLALHEERGVIARELHDSLAQSLSYLKIQATRLAAALADGADAAAPRAVLEELREGINSAYRQLRELLTTFRLKMDDRGLARALEATVDEFRARGAVDIRLDNALPSTLLGANEELHVLQIVREALSNVIRHAGASHAAVTLHSTPAAVEVEVVDDGRGPGPRDDRAPHYGLTIMRERAASLGGALEVGPAEGGGTRVRVAFRRGAAPAAAFPEPVVMRAVP